MEVKQKEKTKNLNNKIIIDSLLKRCTIAKYEIFNYMVQKHHPDHVIHSTNTMRFLIIIYKLNIMYFYSVVRHV